LTVVEVLLGLSLSLWLAGWETKCAVRGVFILIALKEKIKGGLTKTEWIQTEMFLERIDRVPDIE
jgi:hypothetical protein